MHLMQLFFILDYNVTSSSLGHNPNHLKGLWEFQTSLLDHHMASTLRIEFITRMVTECIQARYLHWASQEF